jgi:hypothetical protein
MQWLSCSEPGTICLTYSLSSCKSSLQARSGRTANIKRLVIFRCLDRAAEWRKVKRWCGDPKIADYPAARPILQHKLLRQNPESMLRQEADIKRTQPKSQ